MRWGRPLCRRRRRLCRTPPFSYDTVSALSKDMLGLGLSTDEALDRINALADAAAALDWSEGSVSTVIASLESAQLAGKMDSRVVKSLSKMGVNVYGALADKFGISENEVLDKLDELDVDWAVSAIYDYLGEHFTGASAGLVDTYSGASGILESYQDDIGERLGVNKSVISRTITRGLQHISRYVTAKLLIQRCVDKDGYFDYLTFANSAQLLTERQREMMFLTLARDTSYRDMARYVGRHPSCVWRTVARMEERLRGIGVELDLDLSAVKVRRQDWESITEKELAQRLGLSPRFWFGIAHWGERVGDVPLLHYLVLRRLEREPDPGAVAVEIGCSKAFVKKVARAYQGAELPNVPIEDYRPIKPRRVKLPENPYAAFGEGGAIIDHIDAATYRAIQARFGAV